MFFSRPTEYGIKAVLFLAVNGAKSNRYGIKAIANALQLPEPFMGKVLQALVKKGIISSAKGPHGGFYLKESDLNRPMLDIIEAIDGLTIFKQCAIGLHQCNDDHPCPVHQHYGPVRDSLYNSLSTRTIGDFKADIENSRAHILPF